MSFDDELKARMQRAAEEAGRHADPARAAAQVASTTSSTAMSTATVLKIVGGLGALGLGAGAILGVTVLDDDAPEPIAAVVDVDVASGRVYDCPGGAEAGSLQPGDRVFVVGRDGDGGWAALRDPAAISRTVWIPAASLRPDDEATDVPVVECDDDEGLLAAAAPESTEGVDTTDVVDTTEPTDTTDTTEVVDSTTTVPASTTTPPVTTPPATTAPAPQPTPPPATTVPPTTQPPPPPDTQKPTAQSWANAGSVSPQGAGCGPSSPSSTTINVGATDNVGVTQVSATFGPNPSGSLSFSRTSGSAANGTWTATFGPFNNVPAGHAQQVTINVTVRDAAGNSTGSSVQVIVYGSNCGLG